MRALIADCWWSVSVQPSQTIRLTIYDFQLSVKTANVCRDYLRISAVTSRSEVTSSLRSEVTLFEDCGSRGLEVIDVAARRVQLHFHTDQSSQTHRGFLVHYAGALSVVASDLEMPGNGFLHSHSLPFPCNRFPFLPIPNFVTNSTSHGIPIRLFPFLPIPIPEHYIDAA